MPTWSWAKGVVSTLDAGRHRNEDNGKTLAHSRLQDIQARDVVPKIQGGAEWRLAISHGVGMRSDQ
jgi:hypothetical protein